MELKQFLDTLPECDFWIAGDDKLIHHDALVSFFDDLESNEHQSFLRIHHPNGIVIDGYTRKVVTNKDIEAMRDIAAEEMLGWFQDEFGDLEETEHPSKALLDKFEVAIWEDMKDRHVFQCEKVFSAIIPWEQLFLEKMEGE